MHDSRTSDIERTLRQIPGGSYVFAAQFDGRRTGIIVNSVQTCSFTPPMVCVAIPKGHWVSPLVRDSHAFGLSQVETRDRLILKKFADSGRPRDTDPFDCVPTEKLVSGSPLLVRGCLLLDCEVVRHLDLEGDCEIFIGRVLAARPARHETAARESGQ